MERIRPPRRFYSDKIIRPFNLVEATGFNILQVNCILLSLSKQFWLKYQKRQYCVVSQSICNLDVYRKLSFPLSFSGFFSLWNVWPKQVVSATPEELKVNSNMICKCQLWYFGIFGRTWLNTSPTECFWLRDVQRHYIMFKGQESRSYQTTQKSYSGHTLIQCTWCTHSPFSHIWNLRGKGVQWPCTMFQCQM